MSLCRRHHGSARIFHTERALKRVLPGFGREENVLIRQEATQVLDDWQFDRQDWREWHFEAGVGSCFQLTSLAVLKKLLGFIYSTDAFYTPKSNIADYILRLESMRYLLNEICKN